MWRSMPSPADTLRRWWAMSAQAARAAIGLPDYDNYRAHMIRHHPDAVPMEREAFFRDRMEARYGRGRSRCC